MVSQRFAREVPATKLARIYLVELDRIQWVLYYAEAGRRNPVWCKHVDICFNNPYLNSTLKEGLSFFSSQS